MGQVSARPLLWWSPAQLDALALVLAGPWSAWLREWHGLSEDAAGVECKLAHESQDVQGLPWSALAVSGDALAWSDEDRRPGEPVRTSLFGAEITVASASLAAALQDRAWDALGVELAIALGLQRQADGHSPPAADHAPWSGGVVASLSAPAASLRLFLNGPCVAKAIGARASDGGSSRLAPVVEGISQLAVRASVELAGCEIDLGDLQALKVGDILRVPHALEQPMLVQVGDRPVCAAYLGRRGNSRAVELLHAPNR